VDVTPKKLAEQAGNFWERNRLRSVVSEEDFIVGVLAFINLDDTTKRAIKIQKGTATNQTQAGSPLNSTRKTGLEKLNHLNDQQIISLLMYRQKPEASPSRFPPKRWLCTVMEYVLDLEGTMKSRKGNGKSKVPGVSMDLNIQKSNWDHLRLLSRAHMTVIATGILAAVTQYAPVLLSQ
jgi:hypothetical protein